MHKDFSNVGCFGCIITIFSIISLSYNSMNTISRLSNISQLKNNCHLNWKWKLQKTKVIQRKVAVLDLFGQHVKHFIASDLNNLV